MKRDGATEAQVAAADPGSSTWLNANAGSGKTRVLTDRVARLLLEGVSPQNILCLTYTKAAASEMQNRLFARLGSWAMKDDEPLRNDLRELGLDRAISGTDLRAARRLFARAIETPGGLKIQTIHSFCAAILRRFPLEAGVSPQFHEMEDHTANLIRAEVLDDMAEGDDAGKLAALLTHFTGAELEKLVAGIAGNREAFDRTLTRSDMMARLGLPAEADENLILKTAFPSGCADLAHDIAERFADQTKTYTNFALDLTRIQFEEPGAEDLEALFGLMLYADKTSRSRNFPQSAHKKAVDAVDDIADDIHGWMDAVAEAYQIKLALAAVDRNLALHRFADAFLARYAMHKRDRGLLDFDDLIEKTRMLLSDRAVADWVLFRLDGGIDHVLVDEAQDTSPAQWDVIRKLTQELLSGSGARAETQRTLFVVGDKKQSIYSFQGADPEEFDRMGTHFGEALTGNDLPFADRNLLYSFRSAPAVLRVVDETFVGDRSQGLGRQVEHIAFHRDMPGRVDLWPLVEKAEKAEPHVWYDPVDVVSPRHHDAVMADRIAAQMERMIREETLPVRVGQDWHHRPITPGDFLILVQRRADLFHEIIRACKSRGLAIAGSDRLLIGSELAVKDLIALLRFLALPEDDLSLAAALRSPLFGWSEQMLFTLAHPRRKGETLWQALRQSDQHTETADVLRALRQAADFLRPFDLLQRILIRHDGRRKLLARLGQEAEEGLDALLSQALRYETDAVPSLTGFLVWFDADAQELKRQTDGQGDQIRVMTVHGAKGLEAPIVILPDCSDRREDVKSDLMSSGEGVLWKTRKEDRPAAEFAVHDDLLAAQRRERLRLLYVAMTRAENWLIVGAAGEIKGNGASWWEAVQDGMNSAGAVQLAVGGIDIQRVESNAWAPGDLHRSSPTKIVAVERPTFDKVAVPVRTPTLSPSDLGGAKVMPGDPSDADPEVSLIYGRAIHALLEHLPHVAHEMRRDRAGKILLDLPDDIADDMGARLIEDAMTLLENARLSEIFDGNARAEVGITASLPELGGARIHGAIDRLIVSDHAVKIIDFKSNRLVPGEVDQVPEGLLRQMGAYTAALRQIYPDKRIEPGILWTATGEIMWLPAQIIADALARVTAS